MEPILLPSDTVGGCIAQSGPEQTRLPHAALNHMHWTMFYQHLTMHCSYQFLLMSYIFTWILSLAHLFYAYFTHGPNKSASAQCGNTRNIFVLFMKEIFNKKIDSVRVQMTTYMSLVYTTSYPGIILWHEHNNVWGNYPWRRCIKWRLDIHVCLSALSYHS